MSQLQGLHLHVQAHVLAAPWEPLECHRLCPAAVRLRVCITPCFPRRWCVCVIPGSLPCRAATTFPQLCFSLGIVGLVTLVHRGGGPRPQTLCGGCPAVHRSGEHHSAPHYALSCEQGPSHLEQAWEEQQLLEVPILVPQCKGCLAAGTCWDGSTGVDPSSPWCPQGLQHSLCGTFRMGLNGKETEGGATHQVSV